MTKLFLFLTSSLILLGKNDPLTVGETLSYRASFRGINAAEASLKVIEKTVIENDSAYHVRFLAKSKGPIHHLFPINDEININNRTREISQNIRCLVCQNQSIDESNSELAKDLKILIREKLIAGVTNDEIYGYLRERYGDYILLKPPLNLNTILLWFLPFIVLIFGSILIFKIIKSNQK